MARPIDHFLAQFERSPGRPDAAGPAWLRDRRREAIDRFAALGFPTPRQEAWRFTNVTPLTRIPFQFQAPTPPPGKPAGTPALNGRFGAAEAAHRLVFVDGWFAPALSRLDALPEGVQVHSLAEAVRRTPDLLEPALARIAPGDHPFVALNTACWQDGALIRIAPGTVLDAPIHLLFLTSGESEADAPAMTHLRNLVLAGAGSQVRIVEGYAGPEETVYFTNAVTEVALEPGAAVEHCKLQYEGRAAYHIATIQAAQERQSRFQSHSLSLGGRLVRNDINTRFRGRDGECRLNGLFLVDGARHVDHHTVIDHAQPACASQELYKGIMDGRAMGVFNGTIRVRPHAQKTSARQASRNLLLSEEAVIETNPQLQIDADDVKCAHGATIGQLDPAALFYLRSRGIGAEAARRMLIFAFANEIVTQVPVPAVREWLHRDLLHRLPGGEALAEAPA